MLRSGKLQWRILYYKAQPTQILSSVQVPKQNVEQLLVKGLWCNICIKTVMEFKVNLICLLMYKMKMKILHTIA
jgi:hypothetical protein